MDGPSRNALLTLTCPDTGGLRLTDVQALGILYLSVAAGVVPAASYFYTNVEVPAKFVEVLGWNWVEMS
jgi:hypothetical protein